jgi:hypothetical protein
MSFFCAFIISRIKNKLKGKIRNIETKWFRHSDGGKREKHYDTPSGVGCRGSGSEPNILLINCDIFVLYNKWVDINLKRG